MSMLHMQQGFTCNNTTHLGLPHLRQSEERCAARGGSNAEVLEVSRRVHIGKVEVVAEVLAGVDDLHEQNAASESMVACTANSELSYTPQLHSPSERRAHDY